MSAFGVDLGALDGLDVFCLAVLVAGLVLRFVVQPWASAALLSARAAWVRARLEVHLRTAVAAGARAGVPPRAGAELDGRADGELDGEATRLRDLLDRIERSPSHAVDLLRGMERQRAVHERGPLAEFWRETFEAAAGYSDAPFIPSRRDAAVAGPQVGGRGEETRLPGRTSFKRFRPWALGWLMVLVALLFGVEQSVAVAPAPTHVRPRSTMVNGTRPAPTLASPAASSAVVERTAPGSSAIPSS